MRPAALAALLIVVALPPARAELIPVAECGSFKARWTAAWRAGEAGRGDLAFGPAGTGRDDWERVGGAPKVDARLRCPEGKLVRIELKENAGAAPGRHGQALLDLAAAALSALDGELGAAEAAGMVETLRRDATPSRDAVSSLGPYEVSYTAGASLDAVVIDMPEN